MREEQISPAGISLTTGGHHRDHHRQDQSPTAKEGGEGAAGGGTGTDVDEDIPAEASSKIETELVEDKESAGDAAGAATPTVAAAAAAGEDGVAAFPNKEKTERVPAPARAGCEQCRVRRTHDACGEPSRGFQEQGTRRRRYFSNGGNSWLTMALLLLRHAMQDTFGNDVVAVVNSRKAVVAAADKRLPSGEETSLRALPVKIDTCGAVARLRVFLVPPTVASRQDVAAGAAGAEAGRNALVRGEAAWRCEVVECTRDSLRSQVMLLVERLRVAVSKS